jgi:hypothetical protein
VNIPAATVMPARSAMSRTAFAHLPSTGCAISASDPPPKHRIIASGNTTSRAPSVAARPVYSSIVARFSATSSVLVTWARAIRIVIVMSPCIASWGG